MSCNHTVMYISHGGGPMPLLGDSGHQEMIETLQQLVADIDKPDAILVISAHWEASVPTITHGKNPNLIYDYYGFPEESYQIQYPCPGDSALAEHIYHALNNAGISSSLDANRGFDHGLFVPLKIMFPEADIPCVQLSLCEDLDAEKHLAIGEALKALEWGNLLVVGSGFSFHNMRAFFSPDLDPENAKNKAFDAWLGGVLTNSQLTNSQRREQLTNWLNAPHARFCHPREEHLLPLHVCYGMVGRTADQSYSCQILNKTASMYLWQPDIL